MSFLIRRSPFNRTANSNRTNSRSRSWFACLPRCQPCSSSTWCRCRPSHARSRSCSTCSRGFSSGRLPREKLPARRGGEPSTLGVVKWTYYWRISPLDHDAPGGVKLSLEISHIKIFYPEELSKINFIQRLTWLILPYFIDKKALPKIRRLILPYFIDEKDMLCYVMLCGDWQPCLKVPVVFSAQNFE